MRRRLHVIPFHATVPREERDPWFLEKILLEANWILRWMVEGCLEWQREGLGYPAAVREASEQYLESEDTLGAWLEACCVEDPSASATNVELYRSWQLWAQAVGEVPASRRSVFKALVEKGYQRHRANGVRVFMGIAVRPSAESCIRSGTSGTGAPPAIQPNVKMGVRSGTSGTVASASPAPEPQAEAISAVAVTPGEAAGDSSGEPDPDPEEEEDCEFGLVGYNPDYWLNR